jgi:hypothetical protein
MDKRPLWAEGKQFNNEFQLLLINNEKVKVYYGGS